MTGAELRLRVRQEFAKRWDSAIYGLGARPHRRGIALDFGEDARFFFEAKEIPKILALLREHFPSFEEETIACADRICQHRFDLLGYQELDYGPEIDWQQDRVSGHSAPRKPWHKIRYLDFQQVGDSKVTWELNRHQHLVLLAKAYRLTGDPRYSVELRSQWRHWRRQNAYPMGINWASSLEVAFRSLSWLWVLRLLEGNEALPETFHAEIVEALALNGRHIERYLSTYFSPNTHLLGEGVALFLIGVLCPQLPHAQRWRKKGWESVLAQAEHQVHPDGLHIEHSTYYHVYALDFFLHARLLAARNGFIIPGKLDQTIERMLKALALLGQAGFAPRFGDDDGGRVFDPRRNRVEHLLDPFATGAVLYARSDFKALAGRLREETLWLLGPRAAEEFDKLPDVHCRMRSAALASSGIYALAGSETSSSQLTIQAGAMGELTAGHGHAGLLSVHLTHGKECLVDPGTFVYTSSGNERNKFRGTAAHNTLAVDRSNHAEPSGAFAWRSSPKPEIDCWIAGESFDLFSGHHEAYAHLPGSPIHRRSVFNLKTHFWLVRDCIEGESTHELELFWHFAPGRVRMSSAGAAVFESEHIPLLAVVPSKSDAWSAELVEGEWSPVYGVREPAPILRVYSRLRLPQEFSTALLTDHSAAQPGCLIRVQTEGALAAGVSAWQYEAGNEVHLMFFSTGGRRWQVGDWSSDAEFVYAGLDKVRQLQRLVMCRGLSVEHAGKRFVAADHPVDWAEWARTDGTWRRTGSDSQAIEALGPTGTPRFLVDCELDTRKGHS